MIRLILVLLVGLPVVFLAQEGGAPADLPAEGAFSHKRHAVLKLKCNYCHTGAEKVERAQFPKAQDCRACHTSMAEREIPSQRIYRLPDFVFFSHGKHAAAKVECTACHGDVHQQDQLAVSRPVTMQACVECHKQTKATVVCDACHELGQ